LDETVTRAADALRRLQQDDGHWVFELEADATIPSEYILLRRWLGEARDPALESAIGRYLRRIQSPAHDGWPLYHDGAFDVSATVKAYYALKLIGDDLDAPHMARARAAVLRAGGAQSANVFTRIQLALMGAGPWHTIPEMPVEMALLPRWFPVHLLKMSYWARTVLVPLLVLMTLRPGPQAGPVPTVPELYAPGCGKPPRPVGKKPFFRWLFGGIDVALKAARPLWPSERRQRAIQWCVDFVTERLNGEDGLGAIYPAMANSVMMYAVLGMRDTPEFATARGSLEKLIVRRPDGEIYVQPCVSPIWDTALAAHAMLEAGRPEDEEAALRGLDWLIPLQVTDLRGDWAEVKPDVTPGGWAFQYANAHYPDTDDTAVVAMALDRAALKGGRDWDDALARARAWIEGMQSRGGGWGAFDADNTHYHLNEIPFADHGALLDPPTVDVSARCVGMLAQMGDRPDSARVKEAVGYLLAEQEKDGSWFGRWGVNYIYGTWSALCGLNGAGVTPDHSAMRKAVAWLERIQNADGGWGEGCDSYKLDYRGYEPAPSTASQTAWALLGLMAAGEVDSPAVARGIAWLQAHQEADGLWGQEHYTGGGFPRVFYLRYHGYPAYFPLWAVARYRNLKRANDKRVGWGI
jgi:squalene-hopene/tetraprenyl-beta-curcumene cyclase